MPALEWSSDLALGIQVIDHDHEQTVDLLNDLLDADDIVFPAMFKLFADHLADHFGHEEDMMTQHGFFAFEPHKAEHDRVLAQFETLGEKVGNGAIEEVRAVIAETVPAWFLDHRATMDHVTANFLIGKIS